MNEKDKQAFKHFLSAYKTQWDLNEYYRTQYDDDLEHYLCYRRDTDYPLAYNMYFPQLLPRVTTMLSRMLEQLYQGGTHDLVGVRPRKQSDVDRAPRVQGLLSYQLETLNDIDMTGGSYLFNLQWMLNAISWGKGIAKLYWRKEQRIAPRRISVPIPQFDAAGNLVAMTTRSLTVEMPQVVYDGPYAEVLHNKCFVPHPSYKSIQKMPFVFCVYKRSLEYIRNMADKGVFKNVDKIGWSGNKGVLGAGRVGEDSAEAVAKSIGLEGVMEKDFESERIAPEVDVIEGYGKYIFPEDETAYEVGSGVKVKGKQSEAIVHIANYKALLSIQKNTYGYRPFFDIGAYWHPELYWDIGLFRLGKDIQEQYNNLANTRAQGAIQAVNQMLQVREDSDIPPEALIWKPFGIVPVSEIGADVAPLMTPDVTQSGVFREQEQFFNDTISNLTGIYDYSMGVTPPRQERVGTIYSLQHVGEARMKLMLMTMDYQGFQPFLKYMMLLNTWHLPDNFEARIVSNGQEGFTPLFSGDIHVDYDFTVRYTAMEPALGKHFKAQQLIQYAQMWHESPYLQQYQFMKAIMEMMDFHDPDKYLLTPQQVQQQQQQMAAQAAQVRLLEAATQDSLRAKEQGREMQRDVVKAIMK